MGQQRVIIIGAGPAGLTAAYQSLKHSLKPIVLEAGDKVGGIARTEERKGYRFDIGGHRFYTKIGQIEELWREMLGKDFRKVPRLSRIYYRDRFFSYPLEIFNALFNLGIVQSCRRIRLSSGLPIDSAAGSTRFFSKPTPRKYGASPATKSGPTGRRSASGICR